MAFRRLDIDENIILRNRIPLLIYHGDWIRLFGNTDDKNIRRAKDELVEAIKERSRLNRRKAALKKEKMEVIKSILEISHEMEEEGESRQSIKLLERYRNRMGEINEELNDIELEQEAVPRRIDQANFNLLKATIYVGYRELKQKEEKLERCIDELDRLRDRLKELIDEKHNHQEWIDSTYSFLHGMLGSEEMEKLDKKIL